jgi:hypothetical protein
MRRAPVRPWRARRAGTRLARRATYLRILVVFAVYPLRVRKSATGGAHAPPISVLQLERVGYEVR